VLGEAGSSTGPVPAGPNECRVIRWTPHNQYPEGIWAWTVEPSQVPPTNGQAKDFTYGPKPVRHVKGLRAPEAHDLGLTLLARYIDPGDYDLAGEILLTWPLTGAPWSPGAAFWIPCSRRGGGQYGNPPVWEYQGRSPRSTPRRKTGTLCVWNCVSHCLCNGFSLRGLLTSE